MHVLGDDNGAVWPQGLEELAFVGDGIGHHAVDFFGTAAVVGQATGEHVGREHAVAVIVGCSLLGLDEFQVGAFEVAKLDGAVVFDRFVPGLLGKVALQVFGLEAPAMSGEDFVAHEAQLLFWEACQVGGVEQVGGEDVGGGHLLEVALHEGATLQVGIEVVSQRPGGVAPVVVEDKEMGHAVDEEFFHSGPFVDSQGDGTVVGEDGVIVVLLHPDEGDGVVVAIDVFAVEFHSAAVIHRGLVEDGAVPEFVTVLDLLGFTN